MKQESTQLLSDGYILARQKRLQRQTASLSSSVSSFCRKRVIFRVLSDQAGGTQAHPHNIKSRNSLPARNARIHTHAQPTQLMDAECGEASLTDRHVAREKKRGRARERKTPSQTE